MLFKKYKKVGIIFFTILFGSYTLYADAPIYDMAIDSNLVIDMSMLEESPWQVAKVDYDAENDYEFVPTICLKDLEHEVSGSDAQDKQGKSLCMLIAAHDSYANLLKFMLENVSMDINAQDHQGKTAMHYAVMSGDVGMVKILLGHGANIDTQDHEGKTPLYDAVEKNHVAIADLLIDQGADKKLGTFENGTVPQDICRTQSMRKIFKK